MPAGAGKQAASQPSEPNFEEAVAKLNAEQVVKGDHNTWIRATRLRHTALAMASLEVAEAIRELKEEIAELQGASGNEGR